MPQPEIEEMTSILQALEIGHTAAAEYAAQLVEDGYDTSNLLADIPEERMQQLGFKQPHIDRVLRARSPNTSEYYCEREREGAVFAARGCSRGRERVEHQLRERERKGAG